MHPRLEFCYRVLALSRKYFAAEMEKEQNLLNYMTPDLTWSRPPQEIGRDAHGLVFAAPDGRWFRVYAKHASSRPMFIYGGHVWKCNHHKLQSFLISLKRERGLSTEGLPTICDYYPGVEELPPLPGQQCHNCKGRRAVWIEKDSPLRIYKTIQGPRWIKEYGSYEWIARGLISKVREKR